MHELSIAHEIARIATAHAESHHASRIRGVTVRIGALSCVYPPSLEFCFEQLSRDTKLEGSRLTIVSVPLTLHCPACDRDVECPSIQLLKCPVCNTQSGDIRAGRELEVESIEIELSPEVATQHD